jgi:hypothetical protein
MRWTSTAELVESTVRAAAAVRTLGMRKAIVGERLDALPSVDAAALIEGLLVRAFSHQGARDALVGMAAWQVELRSSGRLGRLERIRDAVLPLGMAAVAALLDDAPAHKRLPPRGRLREIGMPERLHLRTLQSGCHSPFHRLRFIEQVCLHQSPVMIRRLLAERSVTPRDALMVAARRPTTAAIAFELALNERWMGRASHREALALNPFTPTGLSLALLPTLHAPVVQHLRDAGDVHAALARAAARVLELQRRPALDCGLRGAAAGRAS